MATQELSLQTTKQTKVYTRLLFLRIGTIDTLFERFEAQAALEARWAVNIDELSLDLSSEHQEDLNNGKIIPLEDYAVSNWHPKLYIENSLDANEEIRYRAQKSKRDNQIYVCEQRKLKGSFWEKLELNNFPIDVQDLSITVVSELYDNKVILVADPYRLSAVYSEAFVAQQEWRLYQHVDVKESVKPDLLFLTGDREEDYDDLYENTRNGEVPKRSTFTVTCHVARHSNYFFWNGYFLIFLITLVSLSAFGITPTLPSSRLIIGTLLLLTEIAFRLTLSQSLPTISYLTLLDAYGIASIVFIVIQCFYFAVIGTCMLIGTADGGKPRMGPYSHADYIAFFIFLLLFILIHVAFILWLIFGPYSIRQTIQKKHKDYRMALSNQARNEGSKYGSNFSNQPILYSRIP